MSVLSASAFGPSCLCYLPQPLASADNTDLGFDNSWYHAQPHPIIIVHKSTQLKISHNFTWKDQIILIKNLLIRRMSKRWVYSIREQHLWAMETGREHFTHQHSGVSDFKNDRLCKWKILNKINVVVWRQVKQESSLLLVIVGGSNRQSA